MADQVVMENYEAEVMEQESPAKQLFKKAGLVAIGALAVYGTVSLIKDTVTVIKEVSNAGGMKNYMAAKKFQKENQKAEKEEKKN